MQTEVFKGDSIFPLWCFYWLEQMASPHPGPLSGWAACSDGTIVVSSCGRQRQPGRNLQQEAFLLLLPSLLPTASNSNSNSCYFIFLFLQTQASQFSCSLRKNPPQFKVFVRPSLRGYCDTLNLQTHCTEPLGLKTNEVGAAWKVFLYFSQWLKLHIKKKLNQTSTFVSWVQTSNLLPL